MQTQVEAAPTTALLASIVVPVRNGADDLRGLLRALEAQTVGRDRFEVLIGDDGSDDVLTGHSSPQFRVSVLPGPKLNSYAARNRAAGAARAPVLAFCDADCRPEPTWLESGLAALDDSDVVAGLIRFVVPERPTIWTLMDMDTFLDQERAIRSGNAVTANLFVRRELFDRVGGFDDSLPEHGDFDFVSRCVESGARLSLCTAAVVHHPTRDRARQFLRKVWVMHRWYAARECRSGRRPDGLKLRSWIPVVQPLRARRRLGRTLRLDRRRLNANGVRPRLRDDLRALPLMYLLVPYVAVTAQLRGARDGRRLRDRQTLD